MKTITIIAVLLFTSTAYAGPVQRLAAKATRIRPLQRIQQRIAERPRRVRQVVGRMRSVRVLPRNR